MTRHRCRFDMQFDSDLISSIKFDDVQQNTRPATKHVHARHDRMLILGRTNGSGIRWDRWGDVGNNRNNPRLADAKIEGPMEWMEWEDTL